jgi:hypothetical protein
MKWLAVLILAAVPTWAVEKHLWNGKDLTGWARIPRHEGTPPDQKPGFAVRYATKRSFHSSSSPGLSRA